MSKRRAFAASSGVISPERCRPMTADCIRSMARVELNWSAPRRAATRWRRWCLIWRCPIIQSLVSCSSCMIRWPIQRITFVAMAGHGRIMMSEHCPREGFNFGEERRFPTERMPSYCCGFMPLQTEPYLMSGFNRDITGF